MITAHLRHQQLASLIESLHRLVSILRLDASCQWRGHFESQLARAKRLFADGSEQEHLSELSSSICFVYGGMGSFNDYSPGFYDPTTKRYAPIPGTEDFSAASESVYERALELRVTGRP